MFKVQITSCAVLIMTLIVLSMEVGGGRIGLKNKFLVNSKDPFVLLYEHESFRGEYVVIGGVVLLRLIL
jgi:hypothetical protein